MSHEPRHHSGNLRVINARIGEAERDHDVSALDELLDDLLVFRRADGTIVGNAGFLEAPADRTYVAHAS